MFRPSAAEMVQYFSDFLNEVGEVVCNLKTYAYELAKIPMPHPKLDHVYQSMSSIILSTHRTFNDLTRIQAILSALAKARRPIPRLSQHTPLSHASTSCRSRTEEPEIFFSPRKKHKTQSGLAFFSFCQQKEDRTVNNRKIIKKEDESSFSFENQTVRMIRKLQSATPIKQIGQNMAEQSQTPLSTRQDLPLLPLSNLQNTIQQRLRRMISSSRQLYSRLSQRSQECLELLSSVKQELTLRG